MRKLISSLFAVLFIFNLYFSNSFSYAELDEGQNTNYERESDKYLKKEERFSNFNFDGDNAYVSCEPGIIFKYNFDKQELEDEIAKGEFYDFKIKDNKLYQVQNDKVIILDLYTKNSETVQLVDSEHSVSYFNLIEGGYIYLDNDYSNNKYVYVTHTDKDYKYVSEKYVSVFEPYKDGKIITRLSDGDKEKIAIIDKDKVEYIDFEAPEEGFPSYMSIKYDSKNDKIYLFTDGYLYEYNSQFKIMKKMLFMNSEYIYGSKVYDGNVYYIGIESNKIETVNIETLVSPDKVMRISGLPMEIISKYNATNPNRYIVPAQVNLDPKSEIKSLADDMKQNNIDIYATNCIDTMPMLANQEYIVSLDNSEKIKASVEKMYPFVQNAVKNEGKIYALPLSFSADILNIKYDKNILETIGLTEEDLPKDFSSLLDFFKKAKEKLEQYPEYSLMEMGNDAMIFGAMLSAFNSMCIYQEINNMPIKVNMPENAEILDKVIGFNINIYEQENDGISGGEQGCLVKFSTGIMDYDYSSTDNWKDIDINLYGDIPWYTMLDARCLVLNTFSENKEDAIKFLEWYTDNYEEILRAYALKDFDSEIFDNFSVKQFEKAQKNIEYLEEEKNNTDNENEKKSIDRAIEEQKNDLEWNRSVMTRLSKDKLNEYKAKVDYYYIPKHAYFNVQNESLMNIFKQLLTGQIKSTDTLKEMDNIVQMDMMERK